MKHLIICISLLLFFSCNKKKITSEITTPVKNLKVDDSNFVVNDSFPKGDVRRYGINPDNNISSKNLNNLIVLATKGLPILFPEGRYKTNLVLNNKSNVNFIFKKATICGYVNIIDGSNTINFEGELTILDKLFIRKSNNIIFNNLTIETDTVNNLNHKKNRGVSIYAQSKKISFNKLIINNTGGLNDDFYRFSAAAFQAHGWNNNPEEIYIKRLTINNADRSALYLTGNNHIIENIKITGFGLGSSEKMAGLEDAKPGAEKKFTGVWINKCDNCTIDSLSINNTIGKGAFSLRLDEGKYHLPSFINNIHFSKTAKELPIKDNELTNILVKNEF